MSKVISMAGATNVATTPSPGPASLISGWKWQHILAVVGGSFAIAGGGTIAFLGFRKSKTSWKVGGLILLGAGVLTIGVAWYMAYLRGKATEGVLLGGGKMPADNPRLLPRKPDKNDLVALVDGRMARVTEFSTSLDGSRSYGLRIVEDGTLTLEQVRMKDVQIAGVVAA
jgi:hypothetical protein